MILGSNMYYFFGASQNCYAALKFFGKENVLAVIDNNNRKVGALYEGIPIISFEKFLESWNGETVIITAFAMGKDVVRQLEDNGIKNYFECPYMRTSFFTCREMIDMWNLAEYDSFAILGGNPISDTIAAELGRIKQNCRFQMVSDNISECGQKTDVIINMQEGLELTTPINDCKKVINFWADITCAIEDRYRNLLKYKDAYKGGKCFLIGNGPSLTSGDLDNIAEHHIHSFGCNKIYLMFPGTKWRPDYYVVVDDNTYRESVRCIEKHSFTVFMRDLFGTEIKEGENINLFRAFDERYGEGYPNFSDDMSKGLYGGRTVMYEMLQIAAYMGFKEIYLLGVDFSWGEDGRATHFCSSYMDDNLVKDAMIYKEEQRHAYISAKKYADSHGIKIYNATRGGHLDVFERIELDKLFKNTGGGYTA